MHKPTAASLGLLLALSAAPAALAQLQPPLPSPNATVAQSIGMTKVEVAYSRPHVKGATRKEERVIWGALVPYDQVWRTGANAVTKITFDGDVTVEGQKLAAGAYGLYTIPGKADWTVIFNKVTTGSVADYSAEKDALRVKVKPEAMEMHELFTIEFPQVTSSSAVLALRWEKLSVPVQLAVDTQAQFLAAAKDAVAKAKADDWRTSLTAARYLYDNKYASADAAAFLGKSLAVKETFNNVSFKATVLAGEGKKKEALAAAQKAMALKDADPKPSPEALADLEKKMAEWKAAK